MIDSYQRAVDAKFADQKAEFDAYKANAETKLDAQENLLAVRDVEVAALKVGFPARRFSNVMTDVSSEHNTGARQAHRTACQGLLLDGSFARQSLMIDTGGRTEIRLKSR
jgi:hypothetical protein